MISFFFCHLSEVKLLVASVCPTLCDPMDCSPGGSSVPGILQARILEWVAMPSSRGTFRPRDRYQLVSQLLSHVQLFVIPCTVACQALLSMELSRQEYWSGQPFSFPRDLPDPGIEPGSPAWQADSLPSDSLPTSTREANIL